MMTKPLVSVIMPVYNTERYVAEAVESVFSQTYGNIEVICIDDGSTDGTAAILEKFGRAVTVLRNQGNVGIARSRNEGLRAARGEFIAFIDADDIWKAEKLEKQLAQLEENPDLGVSFCFMQCFLSPELPPEIKKIRYCPPDPSPGYISAAAVIRKQALDKVGEFDERLRVGEFIDWYSRATDLGVTSGMIEEVLYLRRIHETNTGVNERASRSDYLKVARSAIERRKNIETNAKGPSVSKKLPE